MRCDYCKKKIKFYHATEEYMEQIFHKNCFRVHIANLSQYKLEKDNVYTNVISM